MHATRLSAHDLARSTSHSALVELTRLALFGLLALGLCLVPTSALAVLISTGDGTGNTTVPSEHPGLANAGTIGALSGIYVRNGWVLTTDHVGVGPLLLDGVIYEPIPGSAVQFQNPDGTMADLITFKIEGLPPVPDLLLAEQPLVVGDALTMIGNGRDRGLETSWNGLDGWEWLPTQSLRWGTNTVTFTGATLLNTQAFRIDFDEITAPLPGEHEADLVEGDSGGGAFVGEGLDERLVGILFARSVSPSQPLGTSLYSNDGLIVDLYAYRDDIEAIIDQPDCSDGLDDDQDGLIDLEDPGCDDALDSSERGTMYECDNGIDDDGDDLIDFPEDDGCLDPTGMVEAPEPGFGVLTASAALGLAALRRRRTARAQRVN